MSEKLFKVKKDDEIDFFYLAVGENEIPIRGYNKLASLRTDCDHLNTAADAWKARETEELQKIIDNLCEIIQGSENVSIENIIRDAQMLVNSYSKRGEIIEELFKRNESLIRNSPTA